MVADIATKVVANTGVAVIAMVTMAADIAAIATIEVITTMADTLDLEGADNRGCIYIVRVRVLMRTLFICQKIACS